MGWWEIHERSMAYVCRWYICIEGWKNCIGMYYEDIVAKCKEEGYEDLYKLEYYKSREEWDYQSLVHNNEEVFRTWERGKRV